MTATTLGAVRLGTVGAYITSGDLESIRRVRARVGQVTLSGASGLSALRVLARTSGTAGVDLDPATYTRRATDDEGTLFPVDWVAQQRDLGLEVIRSEGVFVRRDDPASLKNAFASKVGDGVVRVVSFSDYWLQTRRVQSAVQAVRNCDDAIAFVFAALFDPLGSAEAVDSLRALMDAAAPTDRRVELLRTDTHAIPFALHGGTHSTIGLVSGGRHHPQPMSRKTMNEHVKRQRSQAVWVPSLLGWQRGAHLAALAPWEGAGITDCACTHCDDTSLLRFASEFGSVPKSVRDDAQAHDVASWAALRNRILGAADPQQAWRDECAAAARVQARLAAEYQVDRFKTPASLRAWK